jgi:CubicO group peptidase (beta-lactamase class C family)
MLSMNQPGAAGALCSTVPDLLTWSAALRSGRVVSPESYEQMTTPFTLNNGSATGYGFGLGIDDLEGRPRVSHGGGINGFVTMLAYFPESDLDIVVLSNTEGGHPDRVTEVIARWALGIEVPVILDEPLSEEQMAVYEGVYEIRPEFELTVFSRGGQLFTQATGQGEFRLRAQGDHVFVPTFDDAVRLVFVVEDGKATTAVLHQGGQVTEAPRVR